jgi:hypothetical protein
MREWSAILLLLSACWSGSSDECRAALPVPTGYCASPNTIREPTRWGDEYVCTCEEGSGCREVDGGVACTR